MLDTFRHVHFSHQQQTTTRKHDETNAWKIEIPVNLELASFLAALVGRLASSDGSFLLLFDLVRQTGCQSPLSRLDRAAKVLDVRFARLRRVNVAVATARLGKSDARCVRLERVIAQKMPSSM